MVSNDNTLYEEYNNKITQLKKKRVLEKTNGNKADFISRNKEKAAEWDNVM